MIFLDSRIEAHPSGEDVFGGRVAEVGDFFLDFGGKANHRGGKVSEHPLGVEHFGDVAGGFAGEHALEGVGAGDAKLLGLGSGDDLGGGFNRSAGSEASLNNQGHLGSGGGFLDGPRPVTAGDGEALVGVFEGGVLAVGHFLGVGDGLSAVADGVAGGGASVWDR